MRINITTILITLSIIHVSARTAAQKVSFNEKSATLAQFFKAVKQQTGYNVLYSNQEVDDQQTVDVNLVNANLTDALDEVLKSHALTYTIDNKTILVTHTQPSLLDRIKEALGAPITVTAKVYDELGQPMPGVNIRIKGTENGTTTDSKGNFSISVPDNNTVLVFSFIGYETQELAAKDIAPGSIITLKVAENNLKEVVINKGYYNEKRELSTGDVAVVSSKEIEQQPVTDPILALEGRVAGLNIQQTSGVPGAYSSITIRGQNSIANGNDPLYIVDGVPFSSLSLTGSIGGGAVGNPSGVSNVTGAYRFDPGINGKGMSPFNALNPEDIESIEVLKDADATAIYGSKGANGVILITTKKGRAGKTQFSLNTATGVGQVTRMMDLLNTAQYLQMRHEAFANDGIPFPSIVSNPADYNYDVDGVWDTTRYTNWQKVLIGNTAHFTNIQGSLSGGNTNTQFVLGGGYSTQGTVFPSNSVDKKASAFLNLSHTSQDQHFHVQLTTNYVNDNSNLPQVDLTSQITLPPDAPALYDKNGNINWQLYQGSNTFNNPIADLINTNQATTNNLISNLDLSYQLVPGLQVKSSFGYNLAQMDQTGIEPSSSQPPPYNTMPNSRVLDYGTTDVSTWIIEPQISFKKKLTRSQFEILIGATVEGNSRNAVGQSAYGFASDALILDPLAATNKTVVVYSNTLYRYDALFGRVSYVLDDKYLLNMTVRRDGSSRFGPDKQFGNFGAVGAGWIFSKERFIAENVPFLSLGKLRGSYGTTGNDQIADYQYLSSYTPLSKTYEGTTGLAPTRLANPDYSWEVVKKLEGGLDLGFLNDRVLASISYYCNRTGNQLVGYPLPAITGFTTVQYNLPAVLQNSGLEISLNTFNFKSKDFTWTTTANFTLPSNKLVSYPNLAGSPYANIYEVGQSIFIVKNYQFTGVDPQTGLYTFKTSNAGGQPSYPQDLYPTVPVTQKYYAGLGNTFSYKGFELTVFIQYVNQTAYNYLYNFYSPGDGSSNEPTVVLNRWQSAGDVTNIERFGTGSSATENSYSNLQFSNAIISSASFLRVKNVEFSYKIPGNWVRSAGFNSARVYLQAQNLFTVTNYLGLDPETGGLSLPPLRMITAGFQVTL